MTNLKKKLKNLFLVYFFAHFPKFWGKEIFSKKSDAITQLHKGYQHHVKIQRNIMTQFQENTRTDGRTEGRTDCISQDPSGYHLQLWQTGILVQSKTIASQAACKKNQLIQKPIFKIHELITYLYPFLTKLIEKSFK